MKQVRQKTKPSNRNPAAIIVAFFVVGVAMVVLFFVSINLGSIKIGFVQLLKGLFVEYDSAVATVYDLRFPRILISVLTGACLAAAGTIFQAVLKNPLADPGILGVSSGAGFAAVLATSIFPQLYFLSPLFSIFGGLLSFVLVYTLAWKGTLSPLRIILIGIAVQALFSGLSTAWNAMSGGNQSGVVSIVDGNITMKTWSDVKMLAVFASIGLVLALLCITWCDLLGLEDKTIRGLGVSVQKIRVFVSIVAVFLVGSCTAVVGSISFLGLLVPHIGRVFVGNRHGLLLPFSMLLGAFCFLGADTLGRTIIYPYEMNASVILSVVGGLFFMILLQRSQAIHGS